MHKSSSVRGEICREKSCPVIFFEIEVCFSETQRIPVGTTINTNFDITGNVPQREVYLGEPLGGLEKPSLAGFSQHPQQLALDRGDVQMDFGNGIIQKTASVFLHYL